MASLLGVNVPFLFLLVFGSGAALAAFAGVIAAPFLCAYPSMGMDILLDCFVVIVIGGFGSILGAVVGGYILGVCEIVAGAFMPEALKNSFPWLVVFIVLLIRPEGLFNVHEKRKRV